MPTAPPQVRLPISAPIFQSPEGVREDIAVGRGVLVDQRDLRAGLNHARDRCPAAS